MKKRAPTAGILACLLCLALAGCTAPSPSPSPSYDAPSSQSDSAPAPSAASSQPEEALDPLPSYGATFADRDGYLAVLVDTLNAILARYRSGEYPLQRQFSANDARLVMAAPGAVPPGVTLPESVTWDDIKNSCNPGWFEDGGEAEIYTVQGSIILENDLYMNFQFPIVTAAASADAAYEEPEIFFYDPAYAEVALEKPLVVDDVRLTGSAAASATDIYAASFAYEDICGSASLYLPERYVIFSFSDDEAGEYWGGAVYLFDEDAAFTAAPLPPSGVTTKPDDPWGAAPAIPSALKDPLLEEKLAHILGALLQLPSRLAATSPEAVSSR